MKISRALNIVIPLDRGERAIYVHSTPISEEVFRLYWRVLAAAHARLFQEGLGAINGPRVASLMLEDVAKERGAWEGPDGIQNGFMAELHRISNVLVPSPNGWQTVPLHGAVGREDISKEELNEIEGILVFFMLVSVLNKKSIVPGMLNAAGSLWDFQTTLYNVTEYAASLPSLTEGASIGVMTAGSSVPS